MIEGGQTRSIGCAIDIVLDQPVRVDGGGGVTELHADRENEDEHQDRVGSQTHHHPASASADPRQSPREEARGFPPEPGTDCGGLQNFLTKQGLVVI